MSLKPQHETATTDDDFAPVEQFGEDKVAATADFPRLFEKTLWDNLDKRFTSIFVATLLINFFVIAYLVLNPPPPMSSAELDRIQKQFARLVLDKTPATEPEAKFIEPSARKDLPPEQTTADDANAGEAAASEGRSTGASSRISNRVAQRGSEQSLAESIGRRTREQITSEVNRTGILGLLTSNSDETSGEAVAEVLNGAGAPMANLDEALANIGRVKNTANAGSGQLSGEGGREVRGGRATNAGGIDALVQGLGEGKSKSVQRSGDLEVGNEEPLIETEDGRVSGSRDQDAVAAVVTKHTSAIQSCYQRELKRSPNLRGKLVVRFVINPQGMVESVTVVSSTLNNATVENCVVQRIKRWDDFGAIDPTKGNSTIRQVYTFGY
jgi:TonB family protein